MVIAVALGLLTGCSTEPPIERTSDTVASKEAAPEPTYIPDVLSPADAEAGANVARDAVAALANHGVTEADWWGAFSAFLSPEAAAAFEGIDPQNVSVTQVTGPAVVASTPSATEMTALVPTDVGQYLVTLNRQRLGAPWAVSLLTPPADLP